MATPNTVGIKLSNRNNLTTHRFKIKSFHFGILLFNTNNSRINSNTLTDTAIFGILIEASSNNNTISTNTIANGEDGIYVFYSSSTTITENTLTTMSGTSLILIGSSNLNSILSNTITDGSNGILIRDSYSNTVSENRIVNNGKGVQLANYAENNKLYRNNLIGNTQQTDIENTSTQNTWDNGYPSGGNYWNDYYGLDAYCGQYQNNTGSDGIGDTPYTIAQGVLDNYPLTHAWGTGYSDMYLVGLVNGTRAYGYDLELEDIARNHFAFRTGGSQGANETANWIKAKLESFGIEAWLEPFTFTSWDLSAKPFLLTDDDGNPGTTTDQTNITSFQPLHFSYPTPSQGTFTDLVVLPLPSATDTNDLSTKTVNMTEWNAINTSGKIVLIGQEVQWCQGGTQAFNNKISNQPPAAIIRTWWFEWMAFVPDWFGSSSGRPLGYPLFWNLHVPIGFVNHEQGEWIRNREKSLNVAAKISVPSTISSGINYNVVGRIKGYADPQKYLIMSGHYDTVMCNGFSDNGAGTAGVLELAKVLSEAVREGIYKPSYTLLFIAFTDEELGLVGAANYVKQHKDQMPNITAVINLDCIGSDELGVSQTDPSNGFDLDQEIIKAATDLAIPISVIAPGGSDQEAFLDPALMNDDIGYYWDIDLGISDAQGVSGSTVLASSPTIYNEQWSTGTPGWIHTSNDNSTSTQTLSWVEADDLENHIKVAFLSAIRLSPDTARAGDLIPDVALLEVVPSKTVVGKSYSMRVNITAINQGNGTLLVTVVGYANSTMTGEPSNAILTSNIPTTTALIWNTTSFAYGNYTITAAIEPLYNEVDTNDNNHTCDFQVHVSVPGDVSSTTPAVYDGTVNMRDVAYLVILFNKKIGSPDFNPNADVNDDLVINMRDIAISVFYFNKHE
jgi:parallel beta-helix repeat protein